MKGTLRNSIKNFVVKLDVGQTFHGCAGCIDRKPCYIQLRRDTTNQADASVVIKRDKDLMFKLFAMQPCTSPIYASVEQDRPTTSNLF